LQIAVLKETRGTGPYCSLIMAVIVLKDVALFVAFTVALGFLQLASSNSILEEDKTGFRSWTASMSTSLVYTIVNLLGSAATGLVLGLAFMRARLWWSKMHPPPLKAPHVFTRSVFVTAQRVCGGAIPIIESSIIYFGAHKLHGDGLLATVTAGVLMSHLRSLHHASGSSERGHLESSNNSSQSETPHESISTLAISLPPVTTVFFGLVGANLHLHKVVHNIVPVLSVFVIRLGAVWLGSALGGKVGGIADPLRRRVWMGMITQAGIAMGLSRVVVSRFPQASWGPEFEAVMAGVVLCNLALGPPLFRAAILASGESGTGRAVESSSKLLSVREDSSTSSGIIRPTLGNIPVINLVASRVGGVSDIAAL